MGPPFFDGGNMLSMMATMPALESFNGAAVF